MAISLPKKSALGSNKIQSFPKTQYDKIKELIDALNNITDGTFSTTTLTATTVATTTLTASGTATFKKPVVRETGAPATITAAQSGTTFIGAKSSTTQTYTLPTTPAAGTFFKFVCGDAGGEVLINPSTGEKIVTLTFAAIGADADTAQISNTTTGIKNTAATNVLGDNITLEFDGIDTWFGQGIAAGIWASQ